MDVDVIVPGHGPLAGPHDVRELKAYFEYLYAEARIHHADGMTGAPGRAFHVARPLGAVGEAERLVCQYRQHLRRAVGRSGAGRARRIPTDDRIRAIGLNASGFAGGRGRDAGI